ncbi:MAG: phospholipid methyltransferase, partial [Bauldia sp.]|nr:phospholipid methyltransferase [Bauldia sp.]
TGTVAAVVSSLPLVARPLADRQALIKAGLARMAPGRPFIQFSYLVKGPVEAIPGEFSAEASNWIWLNLPPARVWLFRRAPAR